MKILEDKMTDGVMCDAVLEESDAVSRCPCCGSAENVALEHTWTASYWLTCEPCGVEIHGRSASELLPELDDPNSNADAHRAAAEDAVRRWNTRASAEA